MAHKNHTPFLKKMLLEFMTEPDPLYAMLEWLTNELMKLEAQKQSWSSQGRTLPNPNHPFFRNPSQTI